MTKVKLPKEVAEAIERERSSGFSEQQILTFPWADYLEGSDRFVIQVYRRVNFDNLVRALYNGYEVEKTPEDNLREYYGRIKDDIDRYDYGTSLIEAEAKRCAVNVVLRILGITIEGIND